MRPRLQVTYVTTLERPWEAIEAMDRCSRAPIRWSSSPTSAIRSSPDPCAYPHHCFIDCILDHYGADFARTPRTDSLSLAYLSAGGRRVENSSAP
jgi:hypothetical protein